MKRILWIAAALTLWIAGSAMTPRSAWAFGVKDVIAMHQSDIPDSLIEAKIAHSATRFDLDVKDLRALKRAGVSDEVISAMLRTEDRGQGAVYYGGRYWPYAPEWSVGLGFGFDPWFYGYHGFSGYRPYRGFVRYRAPGGVIRARR